LCFHLLYFFIFILFYFIFFFTVWCSKLTRHCFIKGHKHFNLCQIPIKIILYIKTLSPTIFFFFKKNIPSKYIYKQNLYSLFYEFDLQFIFLERKLDLVMVIFLIFFTTFFPLISMHGLYMLATPKTSAKGSFQVLSVRWEMVHIFLFSILPSYISYIFYVIVKIIIKF
jgi:hypothetical protein